MSRTSLLAAAVTAILALAPSTAPAQSPPFVARGAVSPVHPFPLWYQSSAGGLQLEPCLDNLTTTPPNPCQLAAGAGVGGGTFNPAQPIAYPTNFPATFRYYLANIEVPITTANSNGPNNRGVVFIAELVGAFTGGAPTTFTHIRIDTNESLDPNTSYTIVHPYGSFTLATDNKGDLCPANNKACDIFFPDPAQPNAFDLVLGPNAGSNLATMGTFLSAVSPPIDFIGDGAARVPVTGSPTANNFVRISGPGLLDTCSTGAACSENTLWTLIGRKFKAAGGPLARFAITGLPGTGGAGVAQGFTVAATDVNGNTITTYAGTVHFTSNDPLATLPGDATLVNGVGTFSATPRTVGTFTVTATDTLVGARSGSGSMAVTAGPAASIAVFSGDGQLGAPSAQLANPLVAIVRDQFGNPTSAVVSFAPPPGGAVSPILFTSNALTGLASTSGTLSPALGAQAFTASAAGVATPATFTATSAQPGAAFSLELTDLAAAVAAGTATPFTVTARDAFGAVATLENGTALTITSSDGAATLPALPALTLGTGAFSATFRTAGTRSLTASIATAPGITATASTSVAAGAATTLSGVSGGGQAGTVGATLAQPLVVKVVDAFDNPKAGVSVTFAAPAGGAVAPTTAVTGADGTASVAATLGSLAGPQTFTATAAGLAGSPLSFAATAAPGAAATLALTGIAATVTAGTPAAFTVTARDQFNNVATGFAGAVAITSSDPAAVLPPSAALVAGTGGFSVQLRTAGSRSVTATAVSNAALTGTAGTTVVAAAAAGLSAVSGGGQSGTVGLALGAPFVVKVSDAFGNGVAGVAVTFAAPAGASVSPTSAVTGAGGQAQATGTLSGTVGAQGFSASSAGLTGSPVAFSATAAPGAATLLEVTALDPTVVAGVLHALTVTARDSFGNVATGFAGTVTFTSSDPQAVLPAPGALPAGTASFLATLKTAGVHTITATQTGAPAVTGSASTTVTPNDPVSVALTGAPATTPAGLAFQLSVEVRDAFGNAPASPGLVITSSDANAVLPSNPALTGATGTFSVTLVSAGAQSVTVAAAGFPAVSSTANVTVVAGAASALEVVSGSGQTGTVGQPLGASFVVKATDAFGNAKAGVTVTFSGSGSVSPTSAVTGADGTAATLATLGNVAGPQTFQATAASIPGALATFTAAANPGPGSTLTFSGVPAVVAAGTTLQLDVVVFDAFGNLATGFTGLVTITTSDPAATVPPPAALVAGAGRFPLTLKTVGPHTITAQSPGGAALTRELTTSVTPAAPATLALVSAPGATTVGTAAPSPIVVLVSDSLGNPVPSYPVQFQVFSGSQASITPVNTVTGADGRASATPTVGATAGAYQFSATATQVGTGAQLTGSPLVTTITATPGAAAGLALTRTTSGTLDDCGCYPLTARLHDQFNNTVPQAVEVTVTLTGSAQVTATDLAAAGLPAGAVTGPLKADGTAGITVCDGTPESALVTLTSSTPGLGTATQSLTWNLGPFSAAASLIVSDTASVTAFSGEAHLSVTPRSACGNLLPAGQVVTLGLSGPGSLTPVVGGANGAYTSTLTVDTCPATTTQVTGRVGAADLTPLDVGVLCIVPSADQTSVAIDRPVVVLCDNATKDRVQVSVTPRDAGGVAMGPGNTVALSMPGLTGGAVTDVGDGTYTATISSSTCVGLQQLTVLVNGVALAKPSATIDFSCAPVDATASGVAVPSTHPVADGAATAALTVAAVNTCGDPARAAAVTLSTSLGTLAATSGVTDAAGTFGTTLRSGTPGPATVQATVGGVSLPSATVTFDAPPKSGGGCGTGGGGGVLALLAVGLALGTLRRRARR